MPIPIAIAPVPLNTFYAGVPVPVSYNVPSGAFNPKLQIGFQSGEGGNVTFLPSGMNIAGVDVTVPLTLGALADFNAAVGGVLNTTALANFAGLKQNCFILAQLPDPVQFPSLPQGDFLRRYYSDMRLGTTQQTYIRASFPAGTRKAYLQAQIPVQNASWLQIGGGLLLDGTTPENDLATVRIYNEVLGSPNEAFTGRNPTTTPRMVFIPLVQNTGVWKASKDVLIEVELPTASTGVLSVEFLISPILELG